MILLLTQVLLTLLQTSQATEVPKCGYCGVQGLSAEGDYRAVKLSWRFVRSSIEPPAFRVKYCETSQWHTKGRCRQRVFPLARAVHGKGKWAQKELPPQQLLGRLVRMEKGSYMAIITELRMVTNYSFVVEADFHDWHESSRPYLPTNDDYFPVTVETKGFSGQTIRCLGNVSEVAVNTGPYFGGKISVEGATDESCFLYGNQSSPLEVYAMTINHALCGSKMINNSIETMIVVHENREILTHNSRRFLVVCNFPREYFTLTATVDVPPHLLPKNKKNKHETETLPRVKPQPATEDPNLIALYDKYKYSRMSDSRIQADPLGHLVFSHETYSFHTPIFLVGGILVILGVVVCKMTS